jgi:hypothetical protein
MAGYRKSANTDTPSPANCRTQSINTLRADVKKARLSGPFYEQNRSGLLQFHLFVVNMLASFGIKFLDQHLLGHGLLVFAGGVEVTGASSRFKLDFFASAFGCHGATP